MLVSLMKRQVQFIAAAKSMRRAVIGHIGRALKSIPVERPQDLAVKGKGKIRYISQREKKVIGENTRFTKDCRVGDQIIIPNVSISIFHMVYNIIHIMDI